MNQILVIAIGGALGSVLRFLMANKLQSLSGSYFPYGILLVNITGCLLMGFLATLLVERLMVDPIWRAAILIGFIGGYTTFSSFSIDTLSLLERGLYLPAGLYILSSLVLCLSATGLGIFLGRIL